MTTIPKILKEFLSDLQSEEERDEMICFLGDNCCLDQMMNVLVKEKPDILYPHIKVQLVGLDGNAFAIIARVYQALKAGGVAKIQRDEFSHEAMTGDYDHLLQTCMKWVTVK